jgi:predicted transcriptional regulator
MTNQLKHIFNDTDITQKEIGNILGITQAGASKKILACNFTIVEIVKISEYKGIDFFTEFKVFLSETLRNNNNTEAYKSPLEDAVINLVKKSLKNERK